VTIGVFTILANFALAGRSATAGVNLLLAGANLLLAGANLLLAGASFWLAVASFAATAGLETLALDFDVDLVAELLLIKDFFVIAMCHIPPKFGFKLLYA
jgi:hypothetical protein